VRKFDATDLSPGTQVSDNAEVAIKHFNAVYENETWPLKNANIDNTGIQLLVTFLETLTDACVIDRLCP